METPSSKGSWFKWVAIQTPLALEFGLALSGYQSLPLAIALVALWVVLLIWGAADSLASRDFWRRFQIGVAVLGVSTVLVPSMFWAGVQHERSKPKDAHANSASPATPAPIERYVCVRNVPPILGAGSRAKLIEFGLRNRESTGFYVRVVMDGGWTEFRDGKGEPGLTHLQFTSLGMTEAIYVDNVRSPVVERNLKSPSIERGESYYIYLEGDNLGDTKQVLFWHNFRDVKQMEASEFAKNAADYLGCPHSRGNEL